MSVICTVTGNIDAGSIGGFVLAHEHLWIDLRNQAAPSAQARPVAADDRPHLMQDPYSLRDNLLLDDAAVAEVECRELLSAGCQLVVDCSTAQIGRAPHKLQALSERTGMHIVMGCGYYTGDTYDGVKVASTPPDVLAEEMIHECQAGIDGIRPGVLGEFGTSKEILPQERRALEAAAIAQLSTGLGIHVHIYPWCTNGLEAAHILLERGVPPKKVVICHSDVSPDLKYIHALLKMGVFVEFDNFGKEFTPAVGASFAGGPFIPDSQRTALFAQLIQEGFASQLLMTNDICLKCMLKAFGGQGYTHVLANILPMLDKHIPATIEWKEQILHRNPIEFLV